MVHHWVVWQCNSSFETDYLSENHVPFPGNCFDDTFTNSANPPYTWLNILSYCYQYTLLWAVGADYVKFFLNILS